MPRPKKTEEPCMAVARLIRGYGISTKDLAAYLNCSVPTARRKMQHPSKFLIGELVDLCWQTSIPIEEMKGAIHR